MIKAWDYLMKNPDMVLTWAVDHLMIIGVALSIALVIGVIVGVFISVPGREALADSVLYLAEIVMTIPSMALFGLLMLVLGGLGLSAIGFLPAVIALIVYGQLPILRNTHIAIKSVDPHMIEAGRGMGMSNWQILFKVELPLALPIILAGLRNSIVLLIGIAAIAALIGAGGLGVPIFRGLRTARYDLIVIGGVTVSIFALIIDGFMTLLERWITPRGLKRS
ncbi:MAG: ABC transporter permease [Desulfovermiculus sp.]